MTPTTSRPGRVATAALPRRALAGLLLASGLTFAALPAAAQVAQPRQIAVQGEGQASAAPTEAFIAGGTQIQARTAREAMDGNARAMRQVQEALRQAGIADRDVATSALSLQPQVEYPSGGRPRVTGYVAGHRLRVRLRDLATLGDVLDRMVAAGANQIDGLQLSVPDWSAKVDEAREAAVADARRKAEVLAKAAGARLGKVLSITESGGSMPAPMAVARPRSASYASGESVPVATGDQTFRLSVSIAWELVD
ncbi:SIMPL domain-containing protein [Phreatobacter sp.]|uniref:SIMPL domain-containing protein n=1 Tax=Phreatobacter sp. TaxID=1966341 RepID=UPI0022C47748|nr:SIMPL domain-containing protein [Phreatobacter sp.]MCZ8316500.1 SIMPL domain-containing protein [Phreatobacter sp.]